MSETGGEGGGSPQSIRDRLVRKFRLDKSSPEKQELTPQQKAQEAFLRLSAQSAASGEVDLIGSPTFIPPVPPNGAFDLKDLKDLTIFRVEHDLVNPTTGEKLVQYDSNAAGDDTIDQDSRYLYVCFTRGQNGNPDTLYVPKWAKGDGKHFKMNPDFRDVVGYPLTAEGFKGNFQTELDWDEPLKTLPHKMFLLRTQMIDEKGNRRPFHPEEATVVFKQVDVVSGGTREKQKSTQTEPQPSVNFNPGIAPNPQAG